MRHAARPRRVVGAHGLRVRPEEGGAKANGAKNPVRHTTSSRGRYSGVDAVTVTGDPDLGEYADPVFHVRLGQVPDSEGEGFG